MRKYVRGIELIAGLCFLTAGLHEGLVNGGYIRRMYEVLPYWSLAAALAMVGLLFIATALGDE